MSPSAASPAPTASVDPDPGLSDVLARVRRLLAVAVLAGVTYGVVTTASRGTCLSLTRDGGVGLDSAARRQAQMCVQADLSASPLVFVILALIVWFALRRVHRRALTASDAVRALDRAASVVLIVAAASAVLSHAWFLLMPFEQWAVAGGPFIAPFPFGSIDFTMY